MYYYLFIMSELCLMSDTTGGFEVDSPAENGLLGVSGASENVRLQQGKQLFSPQLFSSAAMKHDCRVLLQLMTCSETHVRSQSVSRGGRHQSVLSEV